MSSNSKLPAWANAKRGAPSASKLGVNISTDRNVAASATPSVNVGEGENNTFVDTYFTRVPVLGEQTDIIYNGDRLWAKITLTLETAGPVVVGQAATLTPVLSGKGALLQTGVPSVFTIAKGTKLYVASTSINRVRRVIEPATAWGENITAMLTAMLARR